MLSSGAPSGGLSKQTASSSSQDRYEGRRGGLRGLCGLQAVGGDSGAGCSVTSRLLLGECSRAVGDRARLACSGKR